MQEGPVHLLPPHPVILNSTFSHSTNDNISVVGEWPKGERGCCDGRHWHKIYASINTGVGGGGSSGANHAVPADSRDALLQILMHQNTRLAEQKFERIGRVEISSAVQLCGGTRGCIPVYWGR